MSARRTTHRRRAIVALATSALAVGPACSEADVGQATAFYVNVTNTKLLPVLTAKVGSPEYTYDVQARGTPVHTDRFSEDFFLRVR